MKERVKGSLEPRESNVGIVDVVARYLSSRLSRTASFVDRARPDENAIFARVMLRDVPGSISVDERGALLLLLGT